MIKNRSQLLKDVSRDEKKRRAAVLAIADHVFTEGQPSNMLEKHIDRKALERYSRIYVFSIGKAARSLAKGLLPLLSVKPVRVLYADEGHPLPTEKGMQKTRRMMKVAESLTKTDLAIVLISGGGSAMFVCPHEEISLTDMVKVTHQLLHSGASIHELNTVRKHLSQVKGGRFARLLEPATVWGFIMSDVIGNDFSTIASGPLSPDPTTFRDAFDVIQKYGIRAPASVVRVLQKGMNGEYTETPKKTDTCFNKIHLKLIADHSTIRRLASEKARALKIPTFILQKPIEGEAREAALTFVKQAVAHKLVIASGETTVTCCKHPGHGGRNQEFLLSALRTLPAGTTLLSVGTDGVDGMCPSPTAGALIDAFLKDRAAQKGLGVEKFLTRNDSYSFFKAVGGLIKTGPTGTNLGDLVLMLS